MAPKCFKIIKNGQSRGVLELSFHGDLKFVSLNAILEFLMAEPKETVKLPKNLRFSKL